MKLLRVPRLQDEDLDGEVGIDDAAAEKGVNVRPVCSVTAATSSSLIVAWKRQR